MTPEAHLIEALIVAVRSLELPKGLQWANSSITDRLPRLAHRTSVAVIGTCLNFRPNSVIQVASACKSETDFCIINSHNLMDSNARIQRELLSGRPDVRRTSLCWLTKGMS